MAVVLDLSRFGQVHKVLTRAPQSIAGGAEGGRIAERNHVSDHFFNRAMIA